MAILKKLFAYAGNHKYLTMLSLFLSFISAILLLMPFVWIWKVIQVILDVYPNFSLASDAARYGWYAFTFAVVGILVYVLSLICSHLAAFRIAANMRKDAMHHVMKLPMGYLSKEGSGKVRKIIDESAASTETYLAHQLPDMVQLVTTLIAAVVCLFIFNWRFGIASLIPLALAFVNMSKMLGKDLAQSMKQYMDALEEMSNEAVEYIRGIPVVKTFQQTVFSFEHFHKSIKNYEKFSVGYTNKYTIACWSGYTTEYIKQGYYVTLHDLNVATAFHISHYMLDYMQKYATYSAIEKPSGISDYKGGYIKDEFKSKGDTASENSDAQDACEAGGGEWDDETDTCTKPDDEERQACEADGGTWDSEAGTCTKEDTETNDAETTCINNGGTWDGSACTYPTPEPEPEPTPTPDPSTPETTGYIWYDGRSLYNIFDRL